MRKLARSSLLVAVLVSLGVSGATAQSGSDGSATTPLASGDRLFLGFIEDAVLADRQWWEVQFEVSDGDVVDTTLLRGVVAMQPWRNLELGGRMGFGNTDTPANLPDGTGGTDLDLWGKYYVGSSSRTDLAVGGVLTVPTGDDTAGLGFDAFGIGGFGTVRHRFDDLVLSGHAGIRLNGDGKLLGADVDGEVSPFVGLGVLVPFSDRVTITGELRAEGERFENLDSDFRLAGGVTWRPARRGMVRVAVSVGLSDGSPDAQLLVGYAAQF